MTQLRKMMLEELQRRNYSQTTVNTYLKVVEDFARYFHRSPDQLGKDHIRAYQVYLFQERKLGIRTVGLHTAALRFFFCKTLKRAYPVEEVPYPRAPRRLPIILTREEAIRLIDSASNLFHRAMLITMYSTGMRRAELCRLKVEDTSTFSPTDNAVRGLTPAPTPPCLKPATAWCSLRVSPQKASSPKVSKRKVFLPCSNIARALSAIGSRCVF